MIFEHLCMVLNCTQPLVENETPKQDCPTCGVPMQSMALAVDPYEELDELEALREMDHWEYQTYHEIRDY